MYTITHNMSAMAAQRNLSIIANNKSEAVRTLSSGFRINSASDDAAGLSISSRMRNLIRGLTAASRNVQDGISVCQVADGALSEVHDMLQRMNELSIQAANDTNTQDDRDALQSEMSQLKDEISRVSKTTAFNTKSLFDRDDDDKMWIQSGGGSNQGMFIDIDRMNTDTLGITGVDISTDVGAADAIKSVQEAIDKLSVSRSKIGAQQNRMEFTSDNILNTSENIAASESRISDTDMALAMMEYARNTLLEQIAQIITAQANQSSEGVLALLDFV